MKILLQINTVVNSGSTGRIAEEIGQKAIVAGWKSYIAYGRNERPSASSLIRIGNDYDIKIHGLQTRLLDRHGLGSRVATYKFIRQIEEIKPDIIHLHNIHGYYINIEVLFQYLNKVRIHVIWTLHDCWPITGHCSHFTFVGCEKWKTECFECPQKKEYPASYFFDRSKKNFNLKKQLFTSLPNLTLVPVSNWLSDILKESFLKDSPIQVIHNGIDSDIFKPANEQSIRTKYQIEDKTILLGVASIWSQRKGLNDFIELSRILDSTFQIIIVGISKNQKNKLPNNIIGLERTESVNELAELYSSSDIFINPTYEDNFPTTNLEAMACGAPVITYKTGGSPEAIDDSTGFIVEKGDINGLVEAIKAIKKKGKSFYTDACRQRVLDKYRKEDRYQEYIKLYEDLLK